VRVGPTRARRERKGARTCILDGFLVWNMLEVVVCGLKEELLLERNGGFIYFGDGYV
jgi:hypothetical protein